MTDLAHHAYPSTDPRLDWAPTHDPRSLSFGILDHLEAAGLDPTEDRPRRWRAGATLDQGREGACVGFGWTQELLSAPRPNYRETPAAGSAYAQGVFTEARRDFDEWPGEDYDGTSVLAGAKTITHRGHIGGYRWAFGVDQIAAALIHEGPVVIGIPWLDGMYEVPASGLVNVSGKTVGGHCILLDEYHPGKTIPRNGKVRGFGWHNSWGPDYGRNGRAFIAADDLAGLLTTWGEACVPVDRRRVTLPA